MNHIGDALASSPLLPAVGQEQALGHPGLISGLCRNPKLTEALWRKLFSSGLSFGDRESLMRRSLSEGLLDEVFTELVAHASSSDPDEDSDEDPEDSPSTAMATLVVHNTLGLARQQVLMGSAAWTPAVALAMVTSGTSVPSLSYAVAQQADGGAPLSWLLTATPEEIVDADYAKELERVPAQHWRRLRTALEARPGCVDHFGAPVAPGVALALASSRLLHDCLHLVVDVKGSGHGSLGDMLEDSRRTGNVATLLTEVVTNPYVSLADVEEVSRRLEGLPVFRDVRAACVERITEGFEVVDPEHLSDDAIYTLVLKALPSQRNKARLWELAHLVDHPAFTDDLLRLVVEDFASSGRSTPSQKVRDAVAKHTATSVPTAWRSGPAVALAPPGGFDSNWEFSWDQDLQVLLNATRSGVESRRELLNELSGDPGEVFENFWTLLGTFQGTLGELVTVAREL